MKICIYGGGAIGGYLAAKLSLAGEHEVSVIDIGPQLEAMQKNGIKLIVVDEELVAHPKCTSDTSEVGHQDYVIITLKANTVPFVLEPMQALIGPDTTVVTAVNGIPWWYFYKLEGEHENHRLESVDAGGKQWDAIGPEKILGCVVYPACDVPEPGVVKVVEGNRFTIGEPTGERSERAGILSKALIKAGFKAPVRPRIRDEVWIKLWGNLCFNPVSALTHETLDVIATEDGTRDVARRMMLEAQAIAESLGVKFPIDVDARIKGAAEVGAHKTSMLQDLEAGRAMEIDALVTVVQEVGRLVGIETPTIDTVLALVCQRARVAGCYKG